VTVASPTRPAPASDPATQTPWSSLVIFGATGDLAQRKLLPALYQLAVRDLLPERFSVIGTSRRPLADDEFRAGAAAAIRAHSPRLPDERVLSGLLRRLRYIRGDTGDQALFEELGTALARLDDEAGKRLNRGFYLSTAPALFSPIVERIGVQGLQRSDEAEVRLMIEKPFGRALNEARAFNDRVLSVFDESQVFRIDHYLGKETVQNILALRFANSLFEPIWNRGMISSVQVTVAEGIGIGSRAGYYDRTGALRDMVASHLLQLLAMVAMEPPVDLSADAVRDEKAKVLRAVTPVAAVRARYEAGVVNGEPVHGYLAEDGVPTDSTTDTYVALRLAIDNWRWAGVPFYLRTGKRLARKETEIAVTLRPAPYAAFRRPGADSVIPNQLVLGVQPNERITMELAAKTPGAGMRVEPVTLGFDYGPSFGSRSEGAYERLLLDALRGDATLFTRADEVEAQWSICDPLLSGWSEDRAPLPSYTAGSQGPEEAEGLLLPGDRWREI
jgi:glucose-6-phosphate 1-dehydrogenase